MGRHHCCVSRQPPSPDGQPTRIARDVLKKSLRESPQKLYQSSPQKSAKIHKQSPRAKTSSWASKYSKPEDVAELQAIFEDNDLLESKEPVILIKKSSATLNAVRNKISKRISRDSVLSKRSVLSMKRSRLSVGASDEEVERRRELRDIREKRIREELSNEVIYDDDAKSFASAISLSALPEIRDDKVTLLADEALFPGFEWTPSKLTGSAIFTITGQGAQVIQPQSSPVKYKSTGGIYEFAESPVASSTRSRRHSFPRTSPESALDLLLRGEIKSLEAQSEIPPTPILGPERLPSIADSVIRRTSWRLSFASDARARQLRALSHGSGLIPGVPAVVNLVNPLAMKTWLRSQGLRISSQALETSELSEGLEKTGSHADLCSQESEFGGVDGSEDNRPPVRLHEMQIHQRLASRGLASSISTPQMSTCGSRYDIDKLQTTSASVCHPTSTSRSRRSPDTSSSGITSLHIPGAWGHTLKDGTSSFYPSSSISLDPTPETSRFNLDHLLMSAKLKGLYSSPKASSLPQLPIESGIQQNTPITNTSAISLQIPFEHHKNRLAINDNSSLLASDTSSFQDRERALSLIKARFPELDNGNRGPSSPHSSRFKEDFAASETTGKPSLLSALHISRRRVGPQRSYDGQNSIDQTTSLRHQPNSYGMFRGPNPTGPFKNPTTNKATVEPGGSGRSADKTSVMWERALRMQAEERAEQVMKGLKIPEKYNGKGLTVEFGPLIRSLSGKLKGKSRPVYTDDESAEDPRGNHEEMESEDMSLVRVKARGRSLVDTSITEAWIKELAVRDAQAREATEASARAVSNQSRRHPLASRTSPKTWARFPSHTRLERTGAAKESDNVRSQDFAVRSVSASGAVSYHTHERKHLHPHGRDKAHKIKHKSLPTRLGIGMRNTIYRLRSGKAGIIDDTHGRKSSISLGGELEYPELEIIRGPLEWRSRSRTGLERLEAEVTNLLIREEREHRRARTVEFGGGSFDGSLESGKDDIVAKDDCDDLDISSPKFYDDCLRRRAVERENSGSILSSGSKFLDAENQVIVLDERDKRKTWHGRLGGGNWQEVISNEGGRLRSRSAEVLRRSTVDFARELIDREAKERDRALKAAELL